MDFRTADFMGVGNWDVADILLTKGYLQRRGNEIALTAKGEAATKDSPRDPQRDNNRLFPVAKREVLEVTGIAEEPMMGASVREVQLTWRWSLTELGAEMAKASDRLARKYSPSQVRKASASVRHYDDGWRIEKVDGLW